VQAEFEIRAAQASDLATACDCLAAAGLPTADLTAAHMGAFLLASEQGSTVGMIGIEAYSQIGLLRSLIVDKECRGKGLGAQLVAALETKAAARGLTELWLLTIDADPFFVRLDYEVMQRADAPIEIQNSAEFASLCPGGAVLMRKRLRSD
jgi:N-acetylglutamate synthase-like GNAT family acetyltransferase